MVQLKHKGYTQRIQRFFSGLREVTLCTLCLVSILLIHSCNGGKKEETGSTFRLNMTSGVTSLDPAFARDQANIWMVNALFNGLVQFDTDLNLQPSLAKSWTISEDGLTYTFHLRNDVQFHTNELFTRKKFGQSDLLINSTRPRHLSWHAVNV